MGKAIALHFDIYLRITNLLRVIWLEYVLLRVILEVLAAKKQTERQLMSTYLIANG